MTAHRKVRIRRDDETFEVDAHLAPLLSELWEANIMTTRSCQRHAATRKVWIEFWSAEDAQEFLNAVVGENPNDWARATGWAFRQDEATAGPVDFPFHPADWEFHATVEDSTIDAEPDSGPQFTILISVLFPRRDLARVTQRVAAWRIRQSRVDAQSVR